MTKTLHGNVRGKTFELDKGLGVDDGQEVKVRGTVIKTEKKLPGPRAGWRPGRRNRRRRVGGPVASGHGLGRTKLRRCRMRRPPHKQVAVADERS